MAKISECDVCGKEIMTSDDYTFITISFNIAATDEDGNVIEDAEHGTVDDEMEEYVSMTTCKACNTAARKFLTKEKVLRILSTGRRAKKR